MATRRVWPCRSRGRARTQDLHEPSRATSLGGNPELPAGVGRPQWPGHGPLSFVASMRCAALPHEGLAERSPQEGTLLEAPPELEAFARVELTADTPFMRAFGRLRTRIGHQIGGHGATRAPSTGSSTPRTSPVNASTRPGSPCTGVAGSSHRPPARPPVRPPPSRADGTISGDRTIDTGVPEG
ncbi:DUF1963 domain-containing protein [Streptomyces sp. NPDC008159]|uniref:DUF1963 domain-containing protein n=1 Tax=Streptomyces sp. NPDC008159 TaxID=3364817 RepID=UPI0036F0EAE5